MKIRKEKYDKAVRVNITLPPKLHAQASEVVRRHGFTCLSDYFQSRLRKDAGLELLT